MKIKLSKATTLQLDWMVDQAGQEIEEATLFQLWCTPATDAERDQAICLILQHLNCTIVRTNATKHGSTEIVLREELT